MANTVDAMLNNHAADSWSDTTDGEAVYDDETKDPLTRLRHTVPRSGRRCRVRSVRITT